MPKVITSKEMDLLKGKKKLNRLDAYRMRQKLQAIAEALNEYGSSKYLRSFNVKVLNQWLTLLGVVDSVYEELLEEKEKQQGVFTYKARGTKSYKLIPSKKLRRLFPFNFGSPQQVYRITFEKRGHKNYYWREIIGEEFPGEDVYDPIRGIKGGYIRKVLKQAIDTGTVSQIPDNKKEAITLGRIRELIDRSLNHNT